MRPQLNIVKYTSAELQSYVDDPNSGVRRITHQLHIAVLPGGLADFKATVVDSVNHSKIGKFDAKLNGIVLDVRNIKVLGNQFPIHTDHAELHVDLRADLHVFRPAVGAVIRGVIKHIAKGHISVTIHRVFNVAIRLAGAIGAGALQVNADITIKVTDFDLKDVIPFIAGELDQPIVPKSSLKRSPAALTVHEQPDSEPDSSDSADETRSRLVASVKDEPRTDSDSQSSANESEPDDDDSNDEDVLPAAAIKREPDDEPSSSDADSDAEPVPKRAALAGIKRESASESDSSSDDDETLLPVAAKRKATAVGSGAKQKMRSAVNDLLQNVMSRKMGADIGERTPAKGQAKQSVFDDSLQNFSQFASPGLSSTMLPAAQKLKAKSKLGV